MQLFNSGIKNKVVEEGNLNHRVVDRHRFRDITSGNASEDAEQQRYHKQQQQRYHKQQQQQQRYHPQ